MTLYKLSGRIFPDETAFFDCIMALFVKLVYDSKNGYDTNFTVMAPSSPAQKWGLEGTLRTGNMMMELFTADHYNRLFMNRFRSDK